MRPTHIVSVPPHCDSIGGHLSLGLLRRAQYEASRRWEMSSSMADFCSLTSDLCSPSRKTQWAEHCRGQPNKAVFTSQLQHSCAVQCGINKSKIWDQTLTLKDVIHTSARA